MMPSETENKKDTFKKIPLFSEMSVEQLRKITGIAKTLKYKKSDFLFYDDDPYNGFYLLLKGLVKIFKNSRDGKESVLHIIKPVNLFADVPLFEGGNYPATAQTLENSIVIFIPKSDFLQLIKDDPEISLKMFSGFAKRLKEMTHIIENFSSKEVINRLAAFLLKEVKNSKTDKLEEPYIRLNVPKRTIASYIGTITETLSRTLKKLQDEEIIKVRGKTIIITDYTRLKKLSE
jgi:CRP/FNR family transcriptional regulator, dissimilatory nitrate respiration regulator